MSDETVPLRSYVLANARAEEFRAEVKRLQAALARIAGGGEHYDSAAHLMQIAVCALQEQAKWNCADCGAVQYGHKFDCKACGRYYGTVAD